MKHKLLVFGARSVLEIATNKFRHMNQNVVASFSLPSFGQNFHEETGITYEELHQEFSKQLTLFVNSLKN